MNKKVLVCGSLIGVIAASMFLIVQDNGIRVVHKDYAYSHEAKKVSLKKEYINIGNANRKKEYNKKISMKRVKKLKLDRGYSPVNLYNKLKKSRLSEASRGGYREENQATEVVMEATAYTNSYEDTGKRSGDAGYGITATGTVARIGTVAVDPSVIPLKTKLYITSIDGSKNYGYAIAEDTGSAIKGYKIDLFYNTKHDAIQFGRRKVKVSILK